MDEIRKNINKLKEIMGYELDYFVVKIILK